MVQGQNSKNINSRLRIAVVLALHPPAFQMNVIPAKSLFIWKELPPTRKGIGFRETIYNILVSPRFVVTEFEINLPF